MVSKRILFLAAHLPVLGQHGGGTRMFHNLRILARKWPVTLVSFYESEKELDQLTSLQNLGIEIHAILRRPCPPSSWLIPRPREHDEYASSQMRLMVRQLLETQEFSAVQVEYFQMGQHVPAKFRGLKILTEHEIHFANFYADFQDENRIAWKIQKGYQWLAQLNYEVRTCCRFDRIACMTRADAGRLAQYVPSEKIRVVPIGVDCSYFEPLSPFVDSDDPPILLFVGNYRHLPNQEAVTHFARHIFPGIRKVFPDAIFRVAGANGHLLDIADIPGVQMTGYMDDLRLVYSRARVFVLPILSGNGMRVKLLEAMSMGMAIVGTPLGASGFEAQDGEHLLLAEKPEKFSAQTIRLLQDEGLCRRIGGNARGLMVSQYNWDVLERQFLDLVEDPHE